MTELPIINCDDCGACCMHMGYPPFVAMYDHANRKGDPEWLALSPELAAETRQGAVDGRGSNELPCVWFDETTKKCRHYDLRPSICREFEVGCEACVSHRERRGITT